MEKFNKQKCIKPAEKFKALGHPVRLWIARQLLDGEHCVQEFVQLADFDFSTISQHLAILKNSGVICNRKCGKQVFYKLKCPCIRQFLQTLEENQAKKRCNAAINNNISSN